MAKREFLYGGLVALHRLVQIYQQATSLESFQYEGHRFDFVDFWSLEAVLL